MKKILFAIMLALFAAPCALFAGDPLGEVKELQIVKNLFPPQFEVVEARDLGSIFEVVIREPSRGKQVYYVTKDGKYLLAGGNLFDGDKVNITLKRREEVTKIDVSKLPLKDALVVKKGNGAKKLVMFNDVDCPYCRKAYDWLKNQTNYTLYIFFFPLDMHPKSPEKTVQVFCSKDQETALEERYVRQGHRFSKMRGRRKNVRQAQSHCRGNWNRRSASFRNGHRRQNKWPSGPCAGKLFQELAHVAGFQKGPQDPHVFFIFFQVLPFWGLQNHWMIAKPGIVQQEPKSI